MILLLAAAAHAAPIAGADYRPLGRSDLAWDGQEEAAGHLLGEEGGQLRPSLEPWAGWAFERAVVTAGASVRLDSWTRFTSESLSHEHAGGLRLQTDARYYLEEDGGSLVPFAGLGVHGTIPFVSIRSDLYTEEEQLEYDTAAAELRSEIAGVGGRASLGAEKRRNDGLVLGIRWDLVLHWSQQSQESGVDRRITVKSEPVVALGFRF